MMSRSKCRPLLRSRSSSSVCSASRTKSSKVLPEGGAHERVRASKNAGDGVVDADADADAEEEEADADEEAKPPARERDDRRERGVLERRPTRPPLPRFVLLVADDFARYFRVFFELGVVCELNGGDTAVVDMNEEPLGLEDTLTCKSDLDRFNGGLAEREEREPCRRDEDMVFRNVGKGASGGVDRPLFGTVFADIDIEPENGLLEPLPIGKNDRTLPELFDGLDTLLLAELHDDDNEDADEEEDADVVGEKSFRRPPPRTLFDERAPSDFFENAERRLTVELEFVETELDIDTLMLFCDEREDCETLFEKGSPRFLPPLFDAAPPDGEPTLAFVSEFGDMTRELPMPPPGI